MFLWCFSLFFRVQFLKNSVRFLLFFLAGSLLLAVDFSPVRIRVSPYVRRGHLWTQRWKSDWATDCRPKKNRLFLYHFTISTYHFEKNLFADKSGKCHFSIILNWGCPELSLEVSFWNRGFLKSVIRPACAHYSAADTTKHKSGTRPEINAKNEIHKPRGWNAETKESMPKQKLKHNPRLLDSRPLVQLVVSSFIASTSCPSFISAVYGSNRVTKGAHIHKDLGGRRLCFGRANLHRQMWKSVEIIILNRWKNKNIFQTTNQTFFIGARIANNTSLNLHIIWIENLSQ